MTFDLYAPETYFSAIDRWPNLMRGPGRDRAEAYRRRHITAERLGLGHLGQMAEPRALGKHGRRHGGTAHERRLWQRQRIQRLRREPPEVF